MQQEDRVRRRKLAVFVLVASMLSVAFSVKANAQSKVEIRFVVESPKASSNRATNELTHEQSSLDSALFSVKDLELVAATPSQANPLSPATLTLSIKQALKDSLKSVTSGNIGKRIALVIDGRIIATPQIAGALSQSQVQISLPTFKYASTIALIINGTLKK
jgi:preprotein translocase subunit SecD